MERPGGKNRYVAAPDFPDGPPDDDPFEGLVLDDDFVRGAAVVESTRDELAARRAEKVRREAKRREWKQRLPEPSLDTPFISWTIGIALALMFLVALGVAPSGL